MRFVAMRAFADNLPRPSQRRQRGFGLLEAMLCLSLMALLFLGAMTLILSASRGTVRTQAQVYSTGDAANSIQAVIGQLREASAFSLPTSGTAGVAEATWNPMGTTPLTQFSTILNGETINTAIQVISPPVMTPAAIGYTAFVPKLRVLSTGGGGSFWEVTPYNVQVPGSVAASAVTLIYRGDPDGTPDADPTGNPKPQAGTYLWQYALPADSSFNPALHPPTALCKSVSTAPNAVQFVRPYYVAEGVPEQNELEVKIISSFYSPINGQQTSEEGTGASSSQLTGKCVFMRDHCTVSIVTDSGTRTSNNAFQFH